MNLVFSVEPNDIKKQCRMQIQSNKYKEYTGAYIGKYTYCHNTMIDNGIEFEVQDDHIFYNLQIGNYNSIGNNLHLIIGRNHEIKRVSTGALELMLKEEKIQFEYRKSTFNQKGSIMIQNDVWIGEDVTIMAGVTVGNGSVIVRNSHVVKDVPPYAVVGGNPAKVIGYRRTEEQIKKLQMIQWWNWDEKKIKENADYFAEDIEKFCDTFYPSAKNEFLKCQKQRNDPQDSYFVFVDYYENYCAYPFIIESFLEHYAECADKKLCLFIRNDLDAEPIDLQIQNNLKDLISEVKNDDKIKCCLEIQQGSFDLAKKIFLKCSHYITNRTFDTVYFTCLANLMGIEIISGVDSFIQFDKSRNFIRI